MDLSDLSAFAKYAMVVGVVALMAFMILTVMIITKKDTRALKQKIFMYSIALLFVLFIAGILVKLFFENDVVALALIGGGMFQAGAAALLCADAMVAMWDKASKSKHPSELVEKQKYLVGGICLLLSGSALFLMSWWEYKRTLPVASGNTIETAAQAPLAEGVVNAGNIHLLTAAPIFLFVFILIAASFRIAKTGAERLYVVASSAIFPYGAFIVIYLYLNGFMPTMLLFGLGVAAWLRALALVLFGYEGAQVAARLKGSGGIWRWIVPTYSKKQNATQLALKPFLLGLVIFISVLYYSR